MQHGLEGRPPLRLGIDWGTTHRRTYLLDRAGNVLDRHADELGLLAVGGRFAEALADLLARWQLGPETTVIMAGMVGSRSGWLEVPYCEAPLPLARLAHHLQPVTFEAARVWIVPGVCDDAGPDVMRGEESQILGASLLGGGDGTYLLPGTHSKWVVVQGGCITRIHTFMTGELFAGLRQQGTLAAVLGQPAERPDDFAAGLHAAAEPAALSRQLFGLRAAILRGRCDGDGALARLSGLLIGSEWADPAVRALCAAGPVRLVGDAALARLHQAAARHWGVKLDCLDPDAVFVTALHALFEAREAHHVI